MRERTKECATASGPPLVLIADQGREFVGQPFKDMCTSSAISLHLTDVRAPWQNGRTERHGDIYKKIVVKALWLASPTTEADKRRSYAECNAAKNRLSNRSGFSKASQAGGIPPCLSDTRFVSFTSLVEDILVP